MYSVQGIRECAALKDVSSCCSVVSIDNNYLLNTMMEWRAIASRNHMHYRDIRIPDQMQRILTERGHQPMQLPVWPLFDVPQVSARL